MHNIFFTFPVAVERMEVMAIPKEQFAAVMLKARAFYLDMETHPNNWPNIGHLRRSKSYSTGAIFKLLLSVLNMFIPLIRDKNI